MIAAGQTLPSGKLMESTSFDEGTGCPIGPQEIDVGAASKDKKIVTRPSPRPTATPSGSTPGAYY